MTKHDKKTKQPGTHVHVHSFPRGLGPVSSLLNLPRLQRNKQNYTPYPPGCLRYLLPRPAPPPITSPPANLASSPDPGMHDEHVVNRLNWRSSQETLELRTQLKAPPPPRHKQQTI